MTPAVRVDGVTKVYRTGAYRSSLRELFGRARRSAHVMTAVDNISFSVQPGEAVGLIGHNGAGKTTMLKLLSRVTRPTSGAISVNGRLSSLIQLGAGFHPDLSGNDNVYLNGAILGLGRAEIRRRFDEIVAFAELDGFMDTPVKRYSSGMYARLGFAVAAHVSPDVLLVDEVLAVGDTSFQNKCLAKMRSLVEAGQTIVFVSHNLQAVQNLCQRALWLERGELRLDGPPSEVINAYLTREQTRLVTSEQARTVSTCGPFEVTSVTLRNGLGEKTSEFASGDSIDVEIAYNSGSRIEDARFVIGVADQGRGVIFLATTFLDGWQAQPLSGAGKVSCRFRGVQLMPKAYQIWSEIRDRQGLSSFLPWQPIGAFRVVTPPPALGPQTTCDNVAHLRDDAPVYIPHTWSQSE